MDQTAELKALIGRLQPEELLQFGERAVEEYFFARVADARADGSGKMVEVLWLELDGVDSLTAIVDGMVERGELAETDYSSHWKLP